MSASKTPATTAAPEKVSLPAGDAKDDGLLHATPQEVPASSRRSSSSQRSGSVLDRAFSVENRKTAMRFFSAYTETWIGMSPLWLAGEAIIPGQKVGNKFRKGTSKLRSAAEDVQAAVTTSAKDIVVILDETMRSTKAGSSSEIAKASEVIKAAGENAILVVTTSLDKVQEQLKSQKDMNPQLKRAIKKNGRDVVILLDKGLRHPVVVTGVAQFAKSKGIPHADALLRLASLGLSKILAAMPEVPLEGVEAVVEEVDAAELERTSTAEANETAKKLGKRGEGAPPKTEPVPEGTDPYAKMKKDNQCLVM